VDLAKKDSSDCSAAETFVVKRVITAEFLQIFLLRSSIPAPNRTC
jgi:hypothetical protein